MCCGLIGRLTDRWQLACLGIVSPLGPDQYDDIIDVLCPSPGGVGQVPTWVPSAHRLIAADSGFVYMQVTIVVAPVAMAVSDVYKVA